MPEFADDVEEGEHQNGSGPIPNLFPDKLVDLCLDKVSSLWKLDFGQAGEVWIHPDPSLAGSLDGEKHRCKGGRKSFERGNRQWVSFDADADSEAYADAANYDADAEKQQIMVWVMGTPACPKSPIKKKSQVSECCKKYSWLWSRSSIWIKFSFVLWND